MKQKRRLQRNPLYMRKKVYPLRWVSTEKYIDGMRHIKVKVVTRGFEEDYIYQDDLPTCNKERSRLMFALFLVLH